MESLTSASHDLELRGFLISQTKPAGVDWPLAGSGRAPCRPDGGHREGRGWLRSRKPYSK